MIRGIARLFFFASLAFSLRGQVIINEVTSANDSVLADDNGEFSDWLEIYNAGDSAVNLEGWGLTDSPRTPFKWIFRELNLGSREFVTVFASGKDRQPGNAVPVEPGTVPGLKFWIAADAVETADLRVAGGNRFLRRWADKSGQNNHWTQNSDTAQPLLIANAVNGKAVVRFDGANDVMNLSSSLATNSFTLITVFRTTVTHEVDGESGGGVGGVTGQKWLFGPGHGGDLNGGSGVSVGINGISAYEHGSSYMPALAVHRGAVTGFNVLTLSYASKRPSLFLQGGNVRDGVLSSRAQVTATTQIGAGDYGAFNGDVAEALLYNRTLTEAERAGVEKYLSLKYSISSTLPRHTNFKLSSDGETVVLTKPDGTTADRVEFGAMLPDVSWGRKPDASVAFSFFLQPTPGASNLTTGASEILPAVTFSHSGGFYTNAFDLALAVASAGASIRYTLDGSEPAETSTLYTAPIRIRNRAGTANGISTIPTVPGGVPPSGEVFKGWPVRARAFKTGALSQPAVTQSYFVDARGRGRYSMPVVSIVTDRANFFDPAIGIYVPGNNSNYSQRGDEWERPAHVELFELDNSRALGKDCGVKIHGNTSQNFPIKGLDFNSNGGRGRGTFAHQIFPDRNRYEFDHFMLRPTGHDQIYAFTRDELMQSLMHDAGMESQAARPAVTFVNGEYWGLSYLKEKEDDDFVAAYSNLSTDQVDYLEGYAAAKAGDTQHYDSMINFIASNDMRATANYEEVKTRMEVASYIDYKASEIFYYRWDIGNHRLWRPRTPEGRWRWLQFDNDVGWGGFWAVQPAWDFNMLNADLTPDSSLNGHNNETTTFLLRSLIVNQEFKTDFINRFSDLLNSTFLPTNTIARINAMTSALEPEIAEHIVRWRDLSSVANWRNNVQYLRTYASNRPPAIRRHLTSRFSLSPTAQVRLSVSDPAHGRFRVNTLKTNARTNAPWVGTYFKDLPIKFAAEPADGYRFVRWEGLPGVTTTNVNLVLRGDLAVTAVFAMESISMQAELRGGLLELKAQGPANRACVLELSTNLQTWQEFGMVNFDGTGKATHSLNVSPELPRVFLQLRLVPAL